MARQFQSNEYIQQGDTTILRIGYKDTFVDTLIDTEMIPLISRYHWRITIKRNKMYVVSGQAKNNTLLYLHVLGSKSPITMKGYEFDHIDGNTLDNRYQNLRFVTRRENLDNMHVKSNSKTQIRGVSYDQFHNTYNVDFSYHSERFYLKPFNTLEEAVYARYCLEKSKGVFIMEYTPKGMEIISNIPDNIKREIEAYIFSKISGN